MSAQEEIQRRGAAMHGIRGPVDPAARARIEKIARENEAVRERQREREQGLHAVEMARLRALASWPEGAAAIEKELQRLKLLESDKIACSVDLAEIYKCQGALQMIAELQKVLAEAKVSIQTPRP